jgi:uncharacterized protein YjbI with pentapeptide repeats
MKKDIKERLVELLKTDVKKFNRYIQFSLSVKYWFKCDLTYANLSRADLSRADLSDADLRRADLSDADLSDANLRRANLSRADLSRADLRRADLSDANLSDANLRRADLSDADLSDANLSRADLSDADLRRADLSDADYNEGTAFLLSQCPSEGSFVAWKKASNLIIKLQVTEDSKRSSATTLKCRCSKALVLAIQNMDGTDSEKTHISSDYRSDFVYEIGKIVEEPSFDDNRFNECSSGIHFFISREMAVKYN